MKATSKASGLLTWAEVDLSALRYNFLQIRKKARNREIIPVIKANAYGHGAVQVCRYLSGELEVNNFGLARVNEGAQLRKAGLKGVSLIILGGFFKGEAADIIKYNLEPSVFSKEELVYLDRAAAKAGKTVNAHLKVNTGMNRLGIRPKNAAAFFNFISGLKNINLRSVYTHFANADMENDRLTFRQAAELSAIKKFAPIGVFFHAANSAAIARYSFTYFDAVRPGISLYGSFADKKTHSYMDLKPVMTLKSRVINTAELKPGEIVSYGGMYRAKSNEKTAVIGIGYGDGFRRSLSNNWYMSVKGEKTPIAGRVCMDMTVVKVRKKVRIGDEALIFGRSGKASISVEDLASRAGTISYEIFTGITDRVERVYR